MGGLKKSARKIANKTSSVVSPIGHKLYREDLSKKVEGTTDKYVWGEDPVDPADTAAPEVAPMVMPIADDTELARNRRKRAAARRGGRMSTVLTDTDGLGG
jgi:hypothetical protein